MSEVDAAIAGVTGEHRAALEWFRANKGRMVPWAEIKASRDAGVGLVNSAKGIYKPAYTDFALSARTLQEGPYPDREVEHRPDGSWVVQYFQENPDPDQRDREATNRGLMLCMEQRVPIGFMAKRKPKPGVEYEILGLGLITGWDRGYFTIEGFADDGSTHAADAHPDAARARATSAHLGMVEREDFDATNDQDLRVCTLSSVARRRGQAKFRAKLMGLYGGRCCISDCDFTEALEAAHIAPYRGEHSNHPQNGLLLRSDLHTLFDLGHLAVADDYTVRLSPSAANSTAYAHLAGARVSLPAEPAARPSADALAKHRQWCGL